jgi:hypothetical protein
MTKYGPGLTGNDPLLHINYQRTAPRNIHNSQPKIRHTIVYQLLQFRFLFKQRGIRTNGHRYFFQFYSFLQLL